MHCKHCVKDGGNGELCMYCGEPFTTSKLYDEDTPTNGLRFVSIVLPLVGLILFFLWINEYPNKARSAGLFGFISLIIYILIII